MLAIALLLRRNGYTAARLRVNMIVDRRTREEAEAELAQYLKGVRVEAETRVLELGGQAFYDVIRAHSADARLSFIGLRPPRDDEPAAAYGDYFAHLRSSLAGVPQPIFTLAGENIDFRRIFD